MRKIGKAAFVGVRVTEDHKRTLETLARQLGVSASEVVRQQIGALVERQAA